MLEKLLGENSELSAEVQTSILEAFDAAVQAKLDETFDVKVSEKALALVEAKDAEYQKYLEESEAKLAQDAAEFKSSLVETVDAYLEQYVSEMVTANITDMENDIAAAKAKAIVESFEKLGLNVNVVEKAAQDTIDESVQVVAKELEELKAKFNDTMNENIALKNSIVELKKEEVLKEASEGLTEMQKEKLTKLVEAFAEDRDVESFSKKVSIVIESLTSGVAEVKVIEESATPAKKSEFKSRFL